MGSLTVRSYLNTTFAGGQRHGCWICGCELTRKTATADHLLPISLGGSDKKSNLRPCCFTCNNERGNRELTPEEWAKANAWRPSAQPMSRKVKMIADAIVRHRGYTTGRMT